MEMSHEDITGGRGVRVGNELLAFVRHDETIRCIRDQIVVEPLGIDHGTSLSYAYQGRPVRGRVLATGPGRYLIQYASGNPPQWHPVHSPPPKPRRTASRESKIFRPCDLKVGDIVDLGGLELGGYLFTRVIWGDKDVVICREEDVAIVVEQEAA